MITTSTDKITKMRFSKYWMKKGGEKWGDVKKIGDGDDFNFNKSFFLVLFF